MTTTKTADAVKHESLAAALAAFQMEIPAIAKGKTGDGGTYKYQYAGLDDITPVALPLLAAQGLAWSTKPTLMGDDFVLQYKLAHADSSEAEEGVYPLPDPTSAKPQAIGSAITYARRYTLCAVTGIAPGGDDDDAAAANDKPAAGRKPRAQSKPAPAPEPPAVATPGWAGEILDVNTIDELRAVHARVEEKGELGKLFAESDGRFVMETVALHMLTDPPADVTVGQFIGAVRNAIESKAIVAHAEMEAADEDGEWPVVEIPTGEVPGS